MLKMFLKPPEGTCDETNGKMLEIALNLLEDHAMKIDVPKVNNFDQALFHILKESSDVIFFNYAPSY